MLVQHMYWLVGITMVDMMVCNRIRIKQKNYGLMPQKLVVVSHILT